MNQLARRSRFPWRFAPGAKRRPAESALLLAARGSAAPSALPQRLGSERVFPARGEGRLFGEELVPKRRRLDVGLWSIPERGTLGLGFDAAQGSYELVLLRVDRLEGHERGRPWVRRETAREAFRFGPGESARRGSRLVLRKRAQLFSRSFTEALQVQLDLARGQGRLRYHLWAGGALLTAPSSDLFFSVTLVLSSFEA